VADMQGTPNELITLGYQARKEGRPKEARKIFTESVRLSREAANPSLLAASLTGLGQIERDLKNNGVALHCYREAVTILRTGTDRLRFAHAVRHLADILRHEKDYEEAKSCYDEALQIYRKDGATAPLDLANAIRGFAILKEGTGETEKARSLWEEARALYELAGVDAGVKESQSRIAQLEKK
jgi:tetratricopeptide (TPR) repeat protein